MCVQIGKRGRPRCAAPTALDEENPSPGGRPKGLPYAFSFPRSEASHKVLLHRVSCFAAKRGLIARERPRPASLGLRPIHLQKTLTVSLRAKCRRPAAVALRCALRGYLSHYLSLRNLIVPQRRSAASHKVLLLTFLSRKVRAGRSSGRPGQSRYLLGEAP